MHRLYSRAQRQSQIMESDQSQNFHERLNQWVASQGFWFQLRYSLSGSGLSGTRSFHLLGAALRLLVFLVVVGALVGLYLVFKVNSEGFAESLQQKINGGLHAAETEIKDVKRAGGEGTISQLTSVGGSGTFFKSMEARNVRYRMGLLDALTGTADPGTVSMARLDVELNSGGEDANAARKFSEAVFDPSGSRPNRIEVASANLQWGFSPGPWGAVENSLMKVQRLQNGWRVSFEGGKFTQNWLRNLEISELVVMCSRDGLVFERAIFKRGQGTVDLTGLKVRAGQIPLVEGRAIFKRFPLDAALPPAARSLVEGSFSGEFDVSGSTHTSAGIVFDGRVILEEGDLIRLRDRIHLLRALSVVDAYNNYRRVELRSGSFRLKVGGGVMEIGEVKLDGNDLMTLDGHLKARAPTAQEQQQAQGKSEPEISPLFIPSAGELDPSADSPEQLTLKRAAKAARGEEDGNHPIAPAFDPLGAAVGIKPWVSQSHMAAEYLQFEGLFTVTLPGDAFERAPKLRELYPGKTAAGRVLLEVPIRGTLHELTLEQAEMIYRDGSQ